MNVDDYIKLRFYLNNQNYKEVSNNAHLPDTTVIEKLIYDNDGSTVRYVIRYYLKEYLYDYADGSNYDHRFSANISVSFYIKNNTDSNKHVPHDSININYYMGTFKEPALVESYFEKIWKSLKIFHNYPHKGFY